MFVGSFSDQVGIVSALRAISSEIHPQVPTQQPVLLLCSQKRLEPIEQQLFDYLFPEVLDPTGKPLLEKPESLALRAATSSPIKNRAMRVLRVMGQS